jgi:hypothetical protein
MMPVIVHRQEMRPASYQGIRKWLIKVDFGKHEIYSLQVESTDTVVVEARKIGSREQGAWEAWLMSMYHKSERGGSGRHE